MRYFLICVLAFFVWVSRMFANEFVTVHEDKLTLNDSPFFFSGANQYYLFYKPQPMIDEVFEDAKSLGMTVIRTWAFCEGALHDGYCFQPKAGVYDEPTFKKLDYILYKAKKENIHLVLTLSNNWAHFGGIDEYNRWNNSYNHDDFFKDENTKQVYKNYVKYVLNRVNTLTGVAYKDDPTIMMWELMNEPRSNDSYAFYNWVDEMAGMIKQVDTNHLVSTGSEGSIATEFKMTHASKHIDVASFHLYPDWWNLNETQAEEYIANHARMAKEIGKPVILGEYGLKDRLKRSAVFTNWYNISKQNEVSGMLLWILSGKQMDGSLYPDYDGFTVWCPELTAICDTLKTFR